MKILFVLAALLASAGAFMFAIPRENLNQNASLVCVRNDTYCAMLVRIMSLDSPDRVYFENQTDATDTTHLTENSEGDGTLITGGGTVADPWIIRIEADCSALPTVGETGDIMAAKGVVGVETLTVAVMVKDTYGPLMDQINYAEDVRYRPVCNFTDAGPTEIFAQLFTSGDNDEDLQQVSAAATLTAHIDPIFTFSFNVPFLNAAFIVSLGQPMYWVVSINDYPNSDAKGVFVYDFRVCELSGCDPAGVVITLIDSDGCPIYPDVLPRFTKLEAGFIETANFSSFNLASDPLGYFAYAKADFCFFDENDPRCVDYCQYNTGTRKKRQVSEEPAERKTERVISTRVEIRVIPDSGDNTVIGVDTVGQNDVKGTDLPSAVSESNIGLLAAVITLSALLLVCLIVAVGVFIRLSTRNQRKEAKA